MSRRRFNVTILSYLLILAMVSVIFIYMQNRSVNAASHGRRMDLLLQLRRLDTQLDRDVVQVNSLQLTHYDTIVATAKELRHLTSVMSSPGGGFVGETDESVERALARVVESFDRKLDYLEHIKSQVALLRNELQYLPSAIEELARQQPELGNRLAHLLNRLYLYNLFPSKSDIAWLRTKLHQTRQASAGQSEKPLFRTIILHMDHHLDHVEELVQMRADYNAAPSAERFVGLYTAYSRFYGDRSRRSQEVSFALLSATLLLFVLLALALWRLNLARNETDKAWRQLRDAVESLSEAFSLFDSERRLVLFNSRYVEFYPWLRGHIAEGNTLDDIYRKNALSGQLLPGDSPGGNQPQLPLHNPRTYAQQLADGRWYQASDSPTSDGGMACVRMEITESKRRELQLRKLSRALEQSPVSVIVTDTEGTIEYVNPKFEETTGYHASEAIGQNPRILKSGDKDPEEYRQMWDTIKSGHEWHGVFLNKRKNGDLYWEAASISPLRDDEGRVTHFVAVKEDITQRKRAEDTLRLHATVFDTTAEGIIVTDANNGIKTVNPAFSRITGYSQEEVVGRNPKLLSSGRHDAEFYRQMWLTLVETGHWSGEIWNRRKDGKVYPEWLSVVAIRNEQGNIHEYIGVFSDITQRKRDEEQILHQAHYDALTGLPNRTLLFERLSQTIALAHRQGRIAALLFIDLDRFKGINDGLGHGVGDEMLRLAAERLRVCIGQADTVARFGGDEFVIVLEEVKGIAAVGTLAEKVVRVLSEPFHLDGRELFIGASIGIAIYPDDSGDPETLLRNADIAMYQAKEGGRNQFQFFTPEMNRRTETRLQLERGLRRALDRDEFTIEYQPIFALRDGEIVSVEALLRWNHPQLGPVHPRHFIPLAEDSGLIAPIGIWVLRSACAQVSQWRALPELSHLHLAVNLSSRQWKLGLDAGTIRQVLVETGLDPQALVLEITESMVLEGTEEVIAWLHQIRALGVELAIDDFGTGYSSLSYLKRFPVGELKIDGSFVRDLPGDEESASLVLAILSMARSLGLGVVAEGVETPEQLAFFQETQCDYVQGFLLSPPVPPEAIVEVARRGQRRVDVSTESDWRPSRRALE